MRIHRSITLVATAVLLLWAARPAISHHAFGSEFDPNRPVLLKGKIVASEVHLFIDRLLRVFESMKQDGETFADFTDRVPKAEILAKLDAK